MVWMNISDDSLDGEIERYRYTLSRDLNRDIRYTDFHYEADIVL